ncbi:MAG: hypothetical protein R2932_30575 [Caldilineaceae bacterium]
MLDETPDEGDALRAEAEPTPKPTRYQQFRRRMVRSSTDLALAIGIIGAVSVVSFLREPFRK